MESNEWVTNWLMVCEQEAIQPWRFDFKQFFTAEAITADTEHLELWMKHKCKEIAAPMPNAFTNALEISSKEPNRVAYPIYEALGWLNIGDPEVRGETMNSFKTTFTKTIKKSTNRDEIFKEIKISSTKRLYGQHSELLKDRAYLRFEIVKENEQELDRFAYLTHSVGNFMVFNWRANRYRDKALSIRDYWDITLGKLRDESDWFEYREKSDWNAYINRYFLQPFVKRPKNSSEPYSVAELWEGHFLNGACPKKGNDFQQFFGNVNALIEERGKWITKELCGKLGLTDLEFYKAELQGMDRIHYFEELIAQ